jgi:putative chitinase
MTLNRKTFFAYARRAPFGGKLSTAQVDGCNRLIDACRDESVTDLRHVAYVLASVFHETGTRMQPVRETFAKSDAGAVAALEKAWRAGKLGQVREPYWRAGWFGRGDIQITHQENYRKLGAAIGVNLVDHPALALDPAISARIAVIGMRDGLFAKAKLADFFQAGFSDAVSARRIVNGKDKARLIAGYYKAFHDALVAADVETPQPADVTAADAEPDDVPPAKSASVGTVAVTTGAGAAASLVAAVQSPWAAVALVAILIAAGVGAWLLFTGRLTINRAKAAS